MGKWATNLKNRNNCHASSKRTKYVFLSQVNSLLPSFLSLFHCFFHELLLVKLIHVFVIVVRGESLFNPPLGNCLSNRLSFGDNFERHKLTIVIVSIAVVLNIDVSFKIIFSTSDTQLLPGHQCPSSVLLESSWNCRVLLTQTVLLHLSIHVSSVKFIIN